MKKAVLAAMAVTAITLPGAAEPGPVAVWNPKWWKQTAKGYSCNVAAISGLSFSHRLRVRSGPGTGYPVVAKLRAGTTVFTCNEAGGNRMNDDDRWYGVAFAAAGKPCTGATAKGLDVRLSVRCRTGWVNRNWVTVISG